MKKQNPPYESASDGQEAFDKYKSAPLDFFLVLLDMNMPIMDGFEPTKQIRRFERKRKIWNITIAALTGVASSKSRNRAMDAGVDRYLTKPARMKDVTALIAKVRDKRGATSS
jgi:CheY-like chemotaxis protein